MKWKSLIVIIAVSVYVACNNNDYENLIHTANRWVPATDNIGSRFSHDGGLIQNGIISVDFKMVQMSDSNPWIALICDLGHSLQDYEGITLRYRSEEELVIQLYQTDFGYSGNQTYSHYQISLPSASIWRSRTVYFDDLNQPEWTPAESSEIPFKPENIRSIHFSPAINPQTGGTASLQIRNLNLF